MGVKGRPIVTRSCEARCAKFHTGDRPCQREIPLQRRSLPSSPSPAPCSALFGAPGAYVQEKRMLSEPTTQEDGRNVAGGETHLKMSCQSGKVAWFSKTSVFTCYIRIQGPPSLTLDRPDQDTTQIPERLFCRIHPTAMGSAGLLFLFYSDCVHFRDEMPRNKGMN